MGWISWLLIGLAIIVLICLGVGAFRKKQDPGAHKSRGMIAGIPFDPEKQEAVIRSSICTGEKVAGFKNKEDGHFTEVLVLRTPKDEQYFKDIYGVEKVKTEY